MIKCIVIISFSRHVSKQSSVFSETSVGLILAILVK